MFGYCTCASVIGMPSKEPRCADSTGAERPCRCTTRVQDREGIFGFDELEKLGSGVRGDEEVRCGGRASIGWGREELEEMYFLL